MKKNIHPRWHDDAVINCACGNKFTSGSTNKSISVDVCSKCHPFFTGEMKYVDVQGRVEKFQAKQKKAKDFQSKVTKKKEKAKKQERPETLREMLLIRKKKQKKEKKTLKPDLPKKS